MSFFWYSMTGAAETWKLAPSEQRATVISKIQPAFVTVLDAMQDPQPDWERADYLKLRYLGDWYFDWDAEDLQDAINDLKLFLLKMQDDHGFNIHSARIFATGGRGFHVEIPLAAMVSKIPNTGVTQLPTVYREMAMEVASDHMDMRVYSLRRGRMWRVPNIQRDNGRYKVPISAHEALEMTAERYEQLTSNPRHYAGDPASQTQPWLYRPDGAVPAPMPPEVTLDLQSMFASKREQIESLSRKQVKVKDERHVLAKFSGNPPDGLLALMSGEHLNASQGFNNIALQLAIVGSALGLTEGRFIDLCQGFIKNHSGDGSRYNTPRKREEALRDRFFYVNESPVYVYTEQGLRSICEPGYSPAGLFDSALAGTEYNLAEVDDANPKAALQEEDLMAVAMADRDDANALRMLPTGMYSKVGDTFKRVSTAVMADPMCLYDVSSGKIVGYVIDLKYYSPAKGRLITVGKHSLQANVFNSRASLDGHLAGFGCHFRGSDIQATVVRDLLKDTSMENQRTQFVVTREGLEVIEDQHVVNQGEPPLLLWSTAASVLTSRDVANDLGAQGGSTFTFRPRFQSNSNLNLNAHTYPVPEANQEFAEWFQTMLAVNHNPAVVGTLLGWFVSCFHRQLHHHVHNEFPLVHMFGAAGSGKSTLPKLFIRLFTSNPPGSWEHVGLGMTRFALQGLLTRSSSMPAILDEFKRSSFHERDYMQMLEEFRSAYNQALMGRGGNSDGSAKADYREIVQYARTTPLMILGEAMIEETATRDRIIPIAVNKEGQNVEAWTKATSAKGCEYMTRLGSLIVRRTLRMSVEDFRTRWEAVATEVRQYVSPSLDNRPIHNYATVLLGLDFLAESLKEGVGMDVDALIKPMRRAVLDEGLRQARVTPITPNAIKTLADIAYITRSEPEDSRWAIKELTHYIVNSDEGWIDIDMGATYRVYSDYARAHGMELYYGSVEAFCAGFAISSSIVTDTNCATSPLRKWAATTIFRFNAVALGLKGVEPFKTAGVE